MSVDLKNILRYTFSGNAILLHYSSRCDYGSYDNLSTSKLAESAIVKRIERTTDTTSVTS